MLLNNLTVCSHIFRYGCLGRTALYAHLVVVVVDGTVAAGSLAIRISGGELQLRWQGYDLGITCPQRHAR